MAEGTRRTWLAAAVVLALLFFTALGDAALMGVAAVAGLVVLAVLYREDLAAGMLPRAVAAVVVAACLAAVIALALSARPAG